jgi:hypothetical protein
MTGLLKFGEATYVYIGEFKGASASGLNLDPNLKRISLFLDGLLRPTNRLSYPNFESPG